MSAQPKPTDSPALPSFNGSIALDAMQKEAHLKPGESTFTFIFNLTNRASHEVSIIRTDVSCGCTTVELPAIPWKLAPSESGQLKVHFNAQGRAGTVVKNVLVYTTLGPKSLQIRANLPSGSAERLKNQQAAQSNRQVVFQGECASCHSAPTLNKTGESLFVAACGICHTAEHRASMVPDLKVLKVPSSKANWENIIRNGKPNSLMPAFEKKQGGPLTETQIQSLVSFLSANKEFSSVTTNRVVSPSKP